MSQKVHMMQDQEADSSSLATPSPAEVSSSFPSSSAAASSGAEAGASREEEAIAGPVQLHRVIDVPLAVTLRFGQRQLTLRELLDLSTGALVELDRQVEEPVDLMLGDRLIARGEVVIVDGNYGMRVTEVVENHQSRLQRAAALLA